MNESEGTPAPQGGTMAPPISVGVPVYNGEKYLRVALDALLKQTFTDFEIIICDNASTDSTQAVCKEYAARDKRIRYYRNPQNIGALANFRRVFALSSAKYFQWNSADDYFAPTYLERCKTVLDSDPSLVLCCAKVSVIGETGNVIEESKDVQELTQASPSARFEQKFYQDHRNNTAYGLMRSEVLRRIRLLRDYTGADNVLTQNLSLYGRFHELPEYLFFRRTHPEAFTYKTNLDRIRQFYSPGSKSGDRFALVVSRHLLEYGYILFSTPLPLRERVDLLAFLLRFAWWKKGMMLKEIAVMLSTRRRGAA
ncbi:MAG: glycosyltransferase family 2 protein [Burkholderiales bacterium]